VIEDDAAAASRSFHLWLQSHRRSRSEPAGWQFPSTESHVLGAVAICLSLDSSFTMVEEMIGTERLLGTPRACGTTATGLGCTAQGPGPGGRRDGTGARVGRGRIPLSPDEPAGSGGVERAFRCVCTPPATALFPRPAGRPPD
jgi:hypothetical protein